MGTTAMHFELYRDRNREIRWRLVAKNGKTIADSAESYQRRAGAMKAIRLIQYGAATTEITDVALRRRAAK